MITQENIPYTADEIKAMVKTCEKYNDALERAKYALTTDMDNSGHWAINYIFPELAESKDERIRKAIYNALKYLETELYWDSVDEVDILDAYAWLEKQGEKDPCIGCTNDKGCVTCENGNLKEIKVEQKFKVGDWIVGDEGKCYKIKSVYAVDGGYYIATDKDGEDNRICFGIANEYFHLWTIQDAKDGDVLVNGSNIFMFHFLNDTRLMGYCHANIDDGRFYDDIGKNECFCLIDAIIYPATKEQRDLLFSKIVESGYEWNDDKKELKKTEVSSKESEDERIRKELITHCRNTRCVTEEGAERIAKWIDWLEKQCKKSTIIDIDKMVMEYSQTKDGDFGLPVNCMIRAYRKGINNALSIALNVEKQGEKMVNADEVIAWLVSNIRDYEYFVEWFKKDFDL